MLYNPLISSTKNIKKQPVFKVLVFKGSWNTHHALKSATAWIEENDETNYLICSERLSNSFTFLNNEHIDFTSTRHPKKSIIFKTKGIPYVGPGSFGSSSK